MIVLPMKYIILGLVLIVNTLANPGDTIPNHPNCPEVQGPIPVYFVHPTNCSRFYECKDKDAWEFECSAGLHFNTKINVCDYPEYAQCESQSTDTTTTVISTTSNPIETSEQTTTVGTSSTSGSTNSPTTVDTSTNPHTTPESGTTSAQPTWDPSTTTSYSTPDDFTTTSYSTTNDFTTTSYSTTNDFTTTSYSTPDDFTTTSYPVTGSTVTTSYPVTGSTVTTSYPVTGSTVTTSHWTDITPTYRPPTGGDTPKPNCPPFGATEPNYWADPSDCTRYLGCLENCVQKFKCPDGLYWNVEQKRCDSFGNSHCCPVIPPAPNVWTTPTYNSLISG